jgi:glycosyltransferase involved in cell wall biosynthesis
MSAMVACGADENRIVLVPNAVAVSARDQAERRLTAETVGIVARLAAAKRVDLFLDVVAELRRRDGACSALVVGDGPVRRALEHRARDLGLDGVVAFAGEQANVARFLDRMDIFLTTAELENHPLAVVEAMTRGVPVVAMPCAGALPDLAARGGLLLPDRETISAAAALERLLGSVEDRRTLAARGREVAREHEVDRVLARLERLYAEIA